MAKGKKPASWKAEIYQDFSDLAEFSHESAESNLKTAVCPYPCKREEAVGILTRKRV